MPYLPTEREEVGVTELALRLVCNSIFFSYFTAVPLTVAANSNPVFCSVVVIKLDTTWSTAEIQQFSSVTYNFLLFPMHGRVFNCLNGSHHMETLMHAFKSTDFFDFQRSNKVIICRSPYTSLLLFREFILDTFGDVTEPLSVDATRSPNYNCRTFHRRTTS